METEDYWAATEARRTAIGRRFGVLFQSGALWSSLTVGENVALPLQMFTRLDAAAISRLVKLKLALVGMENAEDQLPSDISGGMKKRAGLARALALDPDVLFFDEPSAGLDPITSSRLDDLILNLRTGWAPPLSSSAMNCRACSPSPMTACSSMPKPRRRSPMARRRNCAIPVRIRKWRPSCGANVPKP